MPQPIVTRTRAAFSMGYGVEVNILADASRMWGLLTDAEGFPRWNSTVSGIEGRIREGERPKLRSMPDLGPVFERFASDLKREAEPA